MKLVAISDTHSKHKKLPHALPEGDVLIHAGDATISGNLEEFGSFCRWLGKQPHPIKLFTPGNHDRCVAQEMPLCRDMLAREGVHLLCDGEVSFNGLRFWGTPWTPTFQNYRFTRDEEDLDRTFSYIPDDTDVLISHGPPWGVLDLSLDQVGLGSRALWKHVKRIRPQLMIFGHVHEDYGQATTDWGDDRGTRFANVATTNYLGRPHNPPVILDLV